MLNREMIIEELRNRGYSAKETTTVKNGVKYDGILIPTQQNLALVLYTEELIKNAEKYNISIEKVVSKIIFEYEKNCTKSFDSKNMEREYVLKNIYIALQKTSNEEMERKETCFSGIEQFMSIRINQDNGIVGTIKVTKEYLQVANVSIDEAWEYAEKNTNKESTIISLKQYVKENLGEPLPDFMIEMKLPLFLVSNESGQKGAAAILNKKMLRDFGNEYNIHKIVVIPSSINEMMIFPYDGSSNFDFWCAMVKDVNETMVRPEDRLSDRVYVMEI